MDIEQLRELIQVFEESSLWEIEIEESGRRVCLKKGQPVSTTVTSLHAPHQSDASTPTSTHSYEPIQHTSAGEDNGLVTINSPMVGVFYAAPAPEEPPFVKPGDTVTENQTVCIVEAMKLMNEVTAKCSGTVEKVLVENGEPVEYGQPLFAVRVA